MPESRQQMAKIDQQQQQQGRDSSLLRLGRSISEMAISRRSDSNQQQPQQKQQKLMLRRQASVGFSSCSGRRRRGLFSWGSAATTSCLPLQQSPPRESITSLLGNESDKPQQSQEEGPEDSAPAPPAVTSCVPFGTLSRAQSSSSWVISLVLGSSSSRSRRTWQEIDSRENPTAARDLATSNPLWRTLTRRLVKQRRQMLNGLLGRRRQSSKMVDFSYDESSYAKNFDMGQETWQRDDPSFRMAAVLKQTQTQCTTIGRSHSVHCLCTGPESIPGGCRNTKISPQMSAPPLWQRRSIAQPVALSELPLNRSNSSSKAVALP